MSKKIGFIGAGNMATAIISSMLNNNYIEANKVYICDLDTSKCERFVSLGAKHSADSKDLVNNCDIIVLAVKPQNFDSVLSSLSDINCESKIFVSIAAGISISYISSFVGDTTRIVRVMPNTPLLLSKGATAICSSGDIADDDFSFIKNMFSLGSVVEVIDEAHMNEIISVNGSSPAYIYLFAKAMVDYAVSCGIDKNAATNLICATLEGSSKMIKESTDDIDTLIKKVSSPGGTTIAALDSLEKDGFYNAVISAMTACTNRAEEIGR